MGMSKNTLRMSPSSVAKIGDENVDLCDINFNPSLSDCYPTANFHSDTPIPDLLGQLVFPNGLCLSFLDQLPFMFSFVLTDVSRVKLFGMALIIY